MSGKNCWCVAVVFVLLLNLASAKNISLTYPKEVLYGEKFSANLKLENFSEGYYDIKIDILGNGKRIAQILNDWEWKSTNYYIIRVMNPSEKSEQEFYLNITGRYSGEAEITVKVRNERERIDSFQAGNISVIYVDKRKEEAKKENTAVIPQEEKPAEETQLNNGAEEKETKPGIITGYATGGEIKIQEQAPAELIKLNEAKQFSGEKVLYMSKTQYIREYGIYAFLVFEIIILIWVLRKRRHIV